LGAYFLVPPFGWVMSLNEHFKDAAAEKYGEPPYGYTELSSLKTFAKKTKLDLGGSMERLEDAGYAAADSNVTLADLCTQYKLNMKLVLRKLKQQGIGASEELTLKQIAANNRTGPHDVYERIKGIVYS
jgi:hypothetical protein